MAEVKLLVLSDLHAADDRFELSVSRRAPRSRSRSPETRASWLNYADRFEDARDPIRSLIRLIEAEEIRADHLVVPGDICDKANGAALKLAWQELESVRSELGASTTIATAGNHDLDSRYRANTYDPRAELLQLAPEFPVTNVLARANFWAYGVAALVLGHIRFVVLNSCTAHGGQQSEIDHGRLSQVALDQLRMILSQPTAASLHVLVCHHHPHPLPLGNVGQDDRMVDGEVLLEVLDDSDLDWLIVHGHRHMARLTYAGGSAASPAVLAAGSAAVALDPPLSTRTRNQVHLVTLHSSSGAPMRGTVDSWSYSPACGWEQASDDGGLPRRCGFGVRGNLHGLAGQLQQAISAAAGPLPWSEVLQVCPEIQFITPRDFQRLLRHAQALGVQLVQTAPSVYEASPL
jgi:3',5'-cyclic AMP phosphodiesterase CpdA